MGSRTSIGRGSSCRPGWATTPAWPGRWRSQSARSVHDGGNRTTSAERRFSMRLRISIVLLMAMALSLAFTQQAVAAALESGERSNLVTHLQSELRDIGFYRG